MKVPRLRFKNDDGREFPEWEEKKIGELGRFIGGGTPTTQNKDFWNGNIPWISSSDLTEESIFQIKATRFISEKAISQSATKSIPKNSVLIVSRVGVGKVAIAKEDICTSQDFTNLVLSSGNPVFFGYLIKTLTNKLLGFNQGTSIKGFVKSDLEVFEMSIPCIQEQTKIANFLTAIDEKITQLSQKHDLLKQYKKGVMQQIFSQKLRFKGDDGRELPKWEFINLEVLACKVNLKNRNLKVNKVLTNSATLGIINQEEYFDKNIANKSNLHGYYIVEINDFVYNPRISTNAPVGPIKRNKLAKGVMSPLYTVFRFKENNLGFFEYFFETTFWHDYMKSIANFGARHDRMNISTKDFFALPVPVPAKQEQTKIANFLTTIDAKITQTRNQLDAVKLYKKGLLQQMFV